MLLRPVRGWIRPTALAAAATGIILFGMGFAGPGRARTRTQAPGASKIPQGVLSGLASGEEREVLVLLRDESIEREAAAMRARAGIRVNNRAVLDFKSAEMGRMKRRVWSTLRAGGVTVLRDYRHLPMSFVRIHSLDALRELAARPEVVAIYENGVRHRALAESLPLIHQPPVEAAGHTGAGTTVAVLDTGVDYTRAAFGSCTAPGEPAGCRIVYSADVAPDDGMLDDVIYHGTNVSGIVLGVAPDAGVAALDVFNGDYAYDSDILAAINWSIDNQAAYNIVAMNMSFAGLTSSTICPGSVYATPFANAREAGILPVAAAATTPTPPPLADPALARRERCGWARFSDSNIMEAVRRANKYISDTAPWELAKDPAKAERLDTVLHTCVEALRCASILLEPVIPGKAHEIRKQLGIKRAPFDFDSAALWDLVPAGTTTAPGEPLFPRIDLEELERAIAEPEPEPLEHKAEIAIHDFGQVELRVVTVEKAEPHPNADKLLVLTVRMGPETRTVVSGIRAHYQPDQLVGKKLILVANLKPVTLRGVRSEGMILAAEDDDGVLSVATLERDLPDGSEVR